MSSNEPVLVSEPLLGEGRPRSFHVRRVAVYLLCAFTDMLVFFHRAAPNVVVDDMADSYGVKVSSLSIFSSMFFYPYAILQCLMGPLVDVFEPGYIMVAGTLLASLGSFFCGISSGLFLGCVGRLLVGIGSSPMYIASMRCIANWFELKYYGIFAGLFVTMAGCGGLIAQYPLAAYSKLVGWRWCFYTVAIAGTTFSLIDIFVIRGSPVTCKYERVNQEDVESHANIKQRFITLWENIKVVVKNKSFWILAVWSLFINGPYYDINGMWAGPWLKGIKKMGAESVGATLMGISIGNVVFAILLPIISELLKTKKWVLVGAAILTCGSLAPFVWVKAEKLSQIVIFILFFIYAAFSNTSTTVAYPLIREYYPGSYAGTAVGISNSFSLISSVVYQPLTGKFIEACGLDIDNNYTEEGYKYGLWLFCFVSSVISIFPLFFVKDSQYPSKNVEEGLLSQADYESIPDLSEQEAIK